MAYLIKSRWINIPKEAIYQQFVKLSVFSWGYKTVYVEEQSRHYLFGEGYAYPYSLPIRIISELSKRLNNKKVFGMTWYKNYNTQAMAYFEEHGEALNQALEYWISVGNNELPKPKILPVNGLSTGDEYIAIIGLFHLAGPENNNNHHLYIDLIDENGNRIYKHDPSLYLKYGWVEMSNEEVGSTAPVRIDKPLNEPGSNIGMSWGQIIYGFYVSGIAIDRFKHIHIRYPKDEEGNKDGHHSHYIVLQKRIYQEDTTPDPDPIPTPDPPMPDEKPVLLIDKSWLNNQKVDDDDYIRIYQKDVSND